MRLENGTRLGPYEITSQLGAGGMGEVWRARDTRLNREVAIKILPAGYAEDEDRLRLFEQEARAAGMLNHPNILTVHDIGRHEDAPYIVSELLEGEELRATLSHGALPVRQAVDYAIQIARGLAAAHAKGIVHRDLKPENLFVTSDGRVKILDFGIAKFITGPQPDSDTASLYSTSRVYTISGKIIGTVAYMSPEQVRGQEADHHADIFAFGTILYEMLAGQRAFTGESPADVMSAILKEEPPELSEARPQISPGLERVVRHCLEKRPEHRFQSASDLGFALEALTAAGPGAVGPRLSLATQPLTAEGAPESASPARRSTLRARLGWVLAGALLLAALPFAVAYFRRAPAEDRATYSYLLLPEKSSSSREALSPDGRRMVMAAVSEGVNRLWLYSFDKPAPVLLAGTEGARVPFWSPDGRSIGFFAQGKLKRIEVSGGTPMTLCDAPLGYGGAWSSGGEILFAPAQFGQGLYRVSESGGVATPVTTLDTTRLELGHIYPSFLPDGRHFIFLVASGQPEYRGIRLGSLDQPQTNFLLRADANAQYSSAGYLLFVRGRRILAQRLEPEKLALSGDPVPVTERVNFELIGSYSDLSVFSDRMLIFRQGGNLMSRLAWFDRRGNQLTAVGPPGEYRALALSPDNQQVILERNDPQTETSDLWQFDLAREIPTRLTSSPASETRPIWSPDGSRMAFASSGEGVGAIWQRGVRGDDKLERLLAEEPRPLAPSDWSRDGKFIVYWKQNDKSGDDIKVLPLSGERKPGNYLATQFDEQWGKVSPDGRWMAYQSNDSGRFEIYVQSFPEPGHKVTVSKTGGTHPRWRSDGKELYYVSADHQLMAAPVQTGGSFTAGAPVALFEIGNHGRRNNLYAYDVSADGQRFLVVRPEEDASTRPLTVLQNWTTLLKQ